MINRLASALFAILPFAFALMRAAETGGEDLRYLWVAFAAFAGAIVRMAVAARGSGRRMTPRTLAAGIFLSSTLFAVVAAWLLGATSGPAIFLVGAAFGFCFALSTFLRLPPR
jgi:hypothetical protein